MGRRNSLSMAHAQRGFSLLETLAAALLFAVSLAGLLQYHQVLQQSWQHLRLQRQAWRLAHQYLEVYEAGGADARMQAPDGWTVTQAETRVSAGCRKITIAVATPYHYQARLGRWFCETPPVAAPETETPPQ
ncbi:hypothetical protein Dd703_3010 [Musicola paradisiaca Ech703]|uniref:Prepilin peptidase dependent protein C-like C-terminal domain-containing protein n=2 Tax=Musicola paradisiaca TaxID=69223 RepID=C6CC25_MUSP7|nr:hypothetical protein Dd703_3010 [Musicola paradisiaca Ech703]